MNSESLRSDNNPVTVNGAERPAALCQACGADVKKILIGALGVSLAVLAAAYGGDWVLWRIRISRSSGYGSVSVRQYYAINEKNSRTEYVYGSTQEQNCVNSLFGHQDLLPCWYLRRHPDRQVKI
jgi:hypothetical protein